MYTLYVYPGDNVTDHIANAIMATANARTCSGDAFLLHQDDRMLIFSTTDNLRHLSHADTYFCDGTFEVSPELYYQMYTIHAFVNQKMSPLVYASGTISKLMALERQTMLKDGIPN
jgi:hypothetical protein